MIYGAFVYYFGKPVILLRVVRGSTTLGVLPCMETRYGDEQVLRSLYSGPPICGNYHLGFDGGRNWY